MSVRDASKTLPLHIVGHGAAARYRNAQQSQESTSTNVALPYKQGDLSAGFNPMISALSAPGLQALDLHGYHQCIAATLAFFKSAHGFARRGTSRDFWPVSSPVPGRFKRSLAVLRFHVLDNEMPRPSLRLAIYVL